MIRTKITTWENQNVSETYSVRQHHKDLSRIFDGY